MKPLKFLILTFSTILGFFTFSVNPVFAENKTFTNPVCRDSGNHNCSFYGEDTPVGYDTNNFFKPVDEFANSFCYETISLNSRAIDYQTDDSNYEYVVFFGYESIDHGEGKKFTSITCTDWQESSQTHPTNPNPVSPDTIISNLPVQPIIPKISGCTNPNAINYNIQATEDNGTCVEKIEGCTDNTAINYNPRANVHIEKLCEYPKPYTPQNITGHIETTQVQTGATQWNVTVQVSMTGASINTNKIQLWDKFSVVDANTNEKTITLSIRQFDDQRLTVECTSYELTIPAKAITTSNGDTNANAITGNFAVTGCEKSTNPNNTNDPNDPNSNPNNQPNHENTIKQDNFYLSLYDTDEKGKIYLNLTNIVYFVGFIVFFSIVFFVLFGFIKNSFLGKQKSRK